MNFEELKGKTLTKIDGKVDDVEMAFHTDNGEKYKLFHHQDCCEHVSINDICGDISDLIGSPILLAEEVTSNDNPKDIKIPEWQDSFTWTFYKLSTVKGSVTIRWYGESNGYYSESVDFEKIS